MSSPLPFADAAYARLRDVLATELASLTQSEQLEVLESLGADMDDRIEHLEAELEKALAAAEPAEAQ